MDSSVYGSIAFVALIVYVIESVTLKGIMFEKKYIIRQWQPSKAMATPHT